MKNFGRYKTPNELKDEDIWFRWFTKKQCLYMAVSAILSVGIFVIMEKMRLTLIGAMATVVLLFAGFMIPRTDMPDDKYLMGGGLPLEEIAIRVIAKAFQKKKIYVSDFAKTPDGE